MNAAVVKPGSSSSDKEGYHHISSNYCTSRFKKMHEMQRQSKLCDIVVTVKGEAYRGHKLVFASASQYFSDMIDDNEQEGILEYQIDYISAIAFKALLQFMYTGEIMITTAIVQDVVKASKRFKIDSLLLACQESMRKLLDPTNCLQIKNIADEEQDEMLYKECHAYSLQHFDEIAKTEEFVQLSLHQVKQLISDEDLLVTSEEKVYSAVLKWVKHDPPSRAANLSELMTYVKLPLLDKVYFTRNVAREPLMKENAECYNLVMEATDYHMGIECEERSSRVLPRKHYRELPYIFVAGGLCGYSAVADCELYDLQTNRWHSFTSMQCSRWGHTLIGFKQLVYAFGGADHSRKVLSSVEYYNPLKDSWTTTTSLPRAKYVSGVCSIDNSIYICGGKIADNSYVNSVDKFDPTTGVYGSSTPMKTKRAQFTPAVADNRIYAIGGFTDGDQVLKSMEMFDPREGKWTTAPHMSTARSDHGVAVLDPYIYTSPAGSSWERFNIRRNAWEPILGTCNAEGPFDQTGSVYLLGIPPNSRPIQFHTDTKAVFDLPPMLKKRRFPGITLMDCLQFKFRD